MKRQIIPEAFVNQRETIDKTLIEAQNQPSSYYTRRNNRRGPQTGGSTNGGASFHAGSLSHSSSANSTNSQQLRYGWNQPQAQAQAAVPLAPSSSNMGMMGVDVYGFRNNGNKFGGTGGAGMVHVPQIFDDQPVTKPLVSLVSLQGLVRNTSDGSPVDPALGSATNVSPSLLPGQGTGMSGGAAGVRNGTANGLVGGMSTFDPFSEKDHLWLFNSSNNFLGGNFAPPSTNIWGDNNKTDAAVWG